MAKKHWRVASEIPLNELDKYEALPKILAQLLYNRGLKEREEVDLFLNPDFDSAHDPYLFKDMKKAVDRLWTALRNQEKIIIHGDYDADGVTGSAVLFSSLRILGADAEVFIPHRENDGYGINMRNVRIFKDKGARLLLTTDCGTSNLLEIEALKNENIDVIVTDHHEVPEVLPPADAILNPKVPEAGYPFAGLTGAGVAYKLMQALFSHEEFEDRFAEKLQDWGGPKGYLKWILDIVAIGTVADIGPLKNENRILVKWGLLVLGKTRNYGLKSLLRLLNNKELNASTIGFQIAPRLNAAGRLDHAEVAFNLLVATDMEEADVYADKLHRLNQDRQRVTEQVMTEALNQVEGKAGKVLFAYLPDWEPGVVGLVAGKLADKFYRPVLVMTKTGGKVVGSGRSVEGFNITKALKFADDCLEKYGGHEQACGFTLRDENALEEFRSQITAYAERELQDIVLAPIVDVDAKINLADLDIMLADRLKNLEPFGEGNLVPKFWAADLTVTAFDLLGNDRNHLRMMVKQGEHPKVYKFMWFFAPTHVTSGLKIGDKIEAVVEMNVNEWNGRREVEFRVEDFKYAGD